MVSVRKRGKVYEFMQVYGMELFMGLLIQVNMLIGDKQDRVGPI